MSLALVTTYAGQGVSASPITVEVHLANGLPAFQLVGMAETCVKEARERVRSALINGGFEFPAKRITVNLAPADIAKSGGRYDLPIAIGILIASGVLPQEAADGLAFVGELSLNGEIKPVDGLIPALMVARQGDITLIYPCQNEQEAGLMPDASSLPAHSLVAVYEHLSTTEPLAKTRPATNTTSLRQSQGWDDIIGQHQAKRALLIAAAGGHNMLMVGPPGSGKSMLASRITSLLPPLSVEQALEVAAIYSVKGESASRIHFTERPFRSPHHTTSAVALTGGGAKPAPGEVSLAHHGVLFLDEMPEFGRKALEVLREPMETGDVHVSRARAQATFPAQFQLIAAMNPTPTGDTKDRRLSPQQQLNYLNRLSGPMLDRIDLQVEVPKQDDYVLASSAKTQQKQDSMDRAKAQAEEARALQIARQGKANAQLAASELECACRLANNEMHYLQQAAKSLNLSMRVFHRTLKVARTIADLDASDTITQSHLAEALGYRALDVIIRQLTAT